MTLRKEDLEILEKKGITPEKFERQLKMLRTGFPCLRLKGAATVGDGITRVTPELEKTAVGIWDDYAARGGKVVKMVPASGAASRMFKNVFAFLNGKDSKPQDDFMKTFFARITEFAFFDALNAAAMADGGKSILSLIADGEYKKVASLLLETPGLGYGKLPKALLRFHKVPGASRTPLEEHLAEGAQYAADRKGNVAVHFTVSEEHKELALRKVEEVKRLMEQKYGVKYDITFSVQKPSTDTVAADLKGEPYRENGDLFFRPGGHGALIENLNDLEADIVFLKNIDNVVPDARREKTILFKKIIGGVLVGAKIRLDEYCRKLENGKTPSRREMEGMLDFARKTLCITEDRADDMDDQELAGYLFGKFNRPVRVCGMVPNEGEPGGGPFLVYGADGTVSPQILETSQIDLKNPAAARMLKEATHFNPVDLVCAVRDYKGRKFNLPDFVDATTGFISQKSREGVEIKALELPGLWNGAMAGWNTIFLEVPAGTFNPVKTVNDLLRPAHQPV
ncbi:MAG: DUF4301 family protein [Porphyromonadaceae bacterium]|nr:DUF4301 family protein [Porphyromonadaceae bacterium]